MSKGYRILASTGIHKGDRDYQQDQVELMQHVRIPNCLLAVLADGMGGRSGGRKASDQVMLTARQLFNRFDPETETWNAYPLPSANAACRFLDVDPEGAIWCPESGANKLARLAPTQWNNE